jgi:hypoxanthine phosphoribosyltransferase
MEIEFTKISSYQGSESKEAKVLIGLKSDIKDRHVILVEDIIDSGKTMSILIPDLMKKGPKSLKLASLLLKSDNLIHDVKIDYLAFDIKKEFIVGYGLDFVNIYQLYYQNINIYFLFYSNQDEFGRNFPDIWIAKDELT